MGLDSLPGSVPVYFAREVAAGDAAEIQQRMEACVARYRAEVPGLPPVTVAILDSATWIRVSPMAPYGIPHHRPDLTPAVVIVPASPAARVASIGVDPAQAPRFFRGIALHELGHLVTWAAVGLDWVSNPNPDPGSWPLPGWYREFAASYLAVPCLPADAPRPSIDWLTSNQPLYPLLADFDRLHEKLTPDGKPYLGTPEYFANGSWAMNLIGEAARRQYPFMGDGFLRLFREQWNLSAPMTTDAVLERLAQSNRELVPWLRSLGAVR
jgi:hypothetical protein